MDYTHAWLGWDGVARKHSIVVFYVGKGFAFTPANLDASGCVGDDSGKEGDVHPIPFFISYHRFRGNISQFVFRGLLMEREGHKMRVWQ